MHGYRWASSREEGRSTSAGHGGEGVANREGAANRNDAQVTIGSCVSFQMGRTRYLRTEEYGPHGSAR